MPGRTLVLTSCSKEKLDHSAPAGELYTGKLFRLVLQYATENHLDLRILSAKYGLVTPTMIIEPYDLRVTGRAQVDALQESVLPALAYLWNNCTQVIIIMGSQYLKVINPILKRQGKWKVNPNVIVDVIHDERGIGGLMQKVHGLINVARAERATHREPYTREVSPASCTRSRMKCKHHACTFDATRKAALPNGNDNPASTPCDYCCKWENEAFPDKYEPEKKGKSMAEQPKPEEKKAETKEPEPSEFGHVCAGCQKPIKPGTNMVQDPHSKEWFHGEHYSMDERHQDPSEDQYECIACSKEFPEAEMHRDRDGETWCKPCWAAEHPRKPRAKKEKDPPLKHPAPKRNAPLAERIAAYTETPEYLYEQWPVAADGEIDLWGAIAVRNLPRPDSSDKAPAIVRKWDEAQKQAKTKEDAEIEDIITRGKFPEHAMNNIATCSKCKLPLSLEIYPADEGFKRCTCKTHENIEWAGTYLYNKIFASHFKEIKALLDKDAREKMNVLAEVLEDA